MAADSYSVAVNYEEYAKNVYLMDGRIFTFLFMMLASKLNIPMLSLMSISVFFAIIISTISVLNIKNQICKMIELDNTKQIIVWLISTSIIFNFMMTEIMYFPESCIMVSSILFYIISARLFLDNKYIKSFIMLLIGVFCYQGTIGFFVVIAITFSLIAQTTRFCETSPTSFACEMGKVLKKNKKFNKTVSIDMLKIILITAIVAISNLVFIKVITEVFNVEQNKQFSIGIKDMLLNIQIIFGSIYQVLGNTCGLLPKGILMIMIITMITVSLILSYKEKEDRVSSLIILMLITIASSFALFLIQRGSLYTGRVHFCIGALIGVSMLYLYSVTNMKDNQKWQTFFVIIVIVYFMLNVVNTLQLTIEHKRINTLEKIECEKIGRMIDEYEERNDIHVKNIVAIRLEVPIENGFFEETRRRTVITYNNLRHYWAYSGVIQYYLQKDLKGGELKQEELYKYIGYITENNLNYGDFVCIGDTLYCPQYIF